MDKCFYIVNWLPEVLKLIILYLCFNVQVQLINSFRLNDGKWMWSFFQWFYMHIFRCYFYRNNTRGKIKTSFYQAPGWLKMYTPQQCLKHALVSNLFYFRSSELCKIMVPSSFKRIWELMWKGYSLQNVLNYKLFSAYEKKMQKTNLIAFLKSLMRCWKFMKLLQLN